jgi:hypothetical protein
MISLLSYTNHIIFIYQIWRKIKKIKEKLIIQKRDKNLKRLKKINNSTKIFKVSKKNTDINKVVNRSYNIGIWQ